MTTGEERQREEAAELDRALEVFDDPQTAVRPGMQLVRDALRGKRDKLAAKLAEQEQVRLDVVVGGVPAAGGGLDPAVLADVLRAVPEVVASAVGGLLDGTDGAPTADVVAVATALRVAGWPDGGPGTRFLGPPADVRGAVRAPGGGGPLLDTALTRLLDEAEASGEAVAPLARLAAERGATVRLVLRLPFADEREVTVHPSP